MSQTFAPSSSVSVVARVLFGGGIFLGSLVTVAILSGTTLSSLWQASAALVVGGGVVVAGIGSFSQKKDRGGFALFLLALGGVGQKKNRGDPRQAGIRLAAMGHGAVFGGTMGGVLGCIDVMMHLDKPELIGPGMALALVAIFYGVIRWGWCKGLEQVHGVAAWTQGDMLPENRDRIDTSPWLLAATFMLLLVIFVVLYALRRTS